MNLALHLHTDCQNHELFDADNAYKKVAEIINYQRSSEHYEENEDKKYAHLMWAASDMYAALEACQDLVCFKYCNERKNDHCEECQQARAALAKAGAA